MYNFIKLQNRFKLNEKLLSFVIRQYYIIHRYIIILSVQITKYFTYIVIDYCTGKILNF